MAIRTAILGYGRSGSSLHANPIEALPDFTVCAVCDIDPKASGAAQKRFGCPVYDDYHEMMRKETPEFVVIVTRSDQHAQMACDCLLAGADVLVTKPWATEMAEAQNIAASARVSGKRLLPWLPARWGVDLVRIQEIVKSGAIGAVYQIRRGEYTLGRRADWQTERRYRGGYLLNWGPHLVDQPLQLADSPVVSVYGELKQRINPGDVEDVFQVIMKTAKGMTITSEFGVADGAMLPSWIIQGDKGTIVVRNLSIELHTASYPQEPGATDYRSPVKIAVSQETLSGDKYGDSAVIYAHIARALRGEEPYAVPISDAIRLTTVLDAARASSASGQVVFV